MCDFSNRWCSNSRFLEKSAGFFFLTLFKMCRQHTNQINFLKQEKRTNLDLQGEMVLFLLLLERFKYENHKMSKGRRASVLLPSFHFENYLEYFLIGHDPDPAQIHAISACLEISINKFPCVWKSPPVVSMTFGWGFIWKSLGAPWSSLWNCVSHGF